MSHSQQLEVILRSWGGSCDLATRPSVSTVTFQISPFRDPLLKGPLFKQDHPEYSKSISSKSQEFCPILLIVQQGWESWDYLSIPPATPTNKDVPASSLWKWKLRNNLEINYESGYSLSICTTKYWAGCIVQLNETDQCDTSLKKKASKLQNNTYNRILLCRNK